MDYRQYDNATGRFNADDALSEATYSNSPYHFAGNNPIYYSDPTGLLSEGFGNFSTPIEDGFANFYNSGGGGEFGGFMSMNGIFQDPNGSGVPLDEVFVTNDYKKPFNYLYGGQNWLYSYISSDRGSRRIGYADSDFWSEANTAIAALGVANGAKTELIEYAGKLGELSKTTSNYLRLFKRAGIVGSAVTAAYSGFNVAGQHNKGGWVEVFKHRDIIDTTVGGVGLAATAGVYFTLVSNPVGWGIGIGVLVYGGATLIYDQYNP